MRNDYRQEAAEYYDLWTDFADQDFYPSQLPNSDADVLELGCGTGRILIPLREHCRYIHGVDHSPDMLDICRRKLEASASSQSPPDAVVQEGDITNLDLGRTFDLVTAPFRVMQNLETDTQIDGLLETIRQHLAPGGRAILNTFRPRRDPDGICEFWSSHDGTKYTNKETPTGTLRMTEDCQRFQRDPLIVFPVLRYERIKNGRVVGQAELPISMRVWYPEELMDLITSAGFRVTDRWGGYAGEPWGQGNELVVAFTHA